MFYFESFPNQNYVVDFVNGTTQSVVDITRRYKFVESVLKNRYVFYTYNVKEGERADIIAHKYYDDVTLDWLIYLVNQIYDPHFEWPYDYNEFIKYMKKKYGSIKDTKTTVHEYYRIIQPKTILFDGTIVHERKIVVDRTEYLTLVADERSSITVYDFEKNANEERRNIKLIDKAYLQQIFAELNGIFD